jgi:hypothetical protein
LRSAVPAQLAEPAREQGACRAVQRPGQPRHQPGLDALGDRVADPPVARELAGEPGRAGRAVLGDLVERRRLVEQALQRDAARRLALGLAHRELDLDLGGCALVAIVAHVRQRGARQDPRAVQPYQAIDPEQLLRLAAHREHVIDRHAPSYPGAGPRLRASLGTGRGCLFPRAPRSRTQVTHP